jgi:hypothetical protein
MGRGCALALLLLGTATARAQEDAPCVSGEEMETRGGPRSAVKPAEARAVAAAFAGVASYRACVSMASLWSGMSRGLLEFERPDRWRWKGRRQPHQGAAISMELIRIGAQSWYRTGSVWESLPPGRELVDALGGAFLPPVPPELLEAFLKEPGKLTKTGRSAGRVGPCDVWEKRGAPGGLRSDFCIGLTDHLPYRHAAGGPAVEAYLQVEFYDFGHPVDIQPPR